MYLSESSRKKALTIYKTLCELQKLYDKGTIEIDNAFKKVKGLLDEDVQLEYLEAYDFETLESVESLKEETLVAIAGKIDNVRLIDNILIS